MFTKLIISTLFTHGEDPLLLLSSEYTYRYFFKGVILNFYFIFYFLLPIGTRDLHIPAPVTGHTPLRPLRRMYRRQLVNKKKKEKKP